MTVGVRYWAVSIRPPLRWSKPRPVPTNSRFSRSINSSRSIISRLAIAKSLPTIIFTTQTPDPLSSNSSYGLYVGFGLEIPVWDGFTRIRNVSRQKAILKQIGAKKGEKENLLEDKWFDILEKIQENSRTPEKCPIPGRTGPAQVPPARSPLPFRRGAPLGVLGESQ